MPLPRSQFLPTKRPFDQRDRTRSQPASPARRLLAAALCLTVIIGTTGPLARLLLLGQSGLWLWDTIAIIAFVAIAGLCAVPIIWFLVARVPTLNRPLTSAPPRTPEQAASMLDATARDTLDPRGYEPPAPSPASPAPKPPGPAPVHYVWGVALILIAGCLATGCVLILIHPPAPASGDTWAGYVIAAACTGLAAIGLVVLASILLKLERKRWRREQASRGRICPRCEYDVRGAAGMCPECGAPIPLLESPDAAAQRLAALAQPAATSPRPGELAPPSARAN